VYIRNRARDNHQQPVAQSSHTPRPPCSQPRTTARKKCEMRGALFLNAY
jgi:hypothetical protein